MLVVACDAPCNRSTANDTKLKAAQTARTGASLGSLSRPQTFLDAQSHGPCGSSSVKKQCRLSKSCASIAQSLGKLCSLKGDRIAWLTIAFLCVLFFAHQLQVCFCMKSGHIESAWRLFSSAARICLDIGMHQGRQSNASNERKRNVFVWWLYAFSQSLALTLGRPPVIRRSDIGVGSPDFGHKALHQ